MRKDVLVMVSSDPRKYRMQHIYSVAIDLLRRNAPVSSDELKRYFDIGRTYKTKNDILRGLLGSLQNKQMQSNVIGFYLPQRADTFKDIFCDYDAKAILDTYATVEALFDWFNSVFTIGNRDSKNNSFRTYAKAVLSACNFIERFEDADDFTKFVEVFKYNGLSAVALPIVLAREIFGLGFALACDWLKEMGFSEYPKPDIHIIEIFHALELCNKNDYSAYKAVIEMAEATGDTAFNVDRTFWLLASGRYFLHDKKVLSAKSEIIKIMMSSEDG